MAKITLTLSLDNDAFSDEAHGHRGGWAVEVARILLTQSRQIDSGWYATPADLPHAVLWDTNGNRVGGWEFDPELPAPAAEVWLGDPDTAPWADLLAQLPTLAQGDGSDLKIDMVKPEVRVWLSRLDIDDGEPFERTVYVEEQRDDGTWFAVGHWDGDETDLTPSHPAAVAALTYTRDLAWEHQ